MASKTRKNVIVGDTNERKCNCQYCNEKINKGDGFALVNSGTYKFTHINCLDNYLTTKQNSETTTKHGFVWRLVLSTYSNINAIDLKMNGWKLTSRRTLAIDTVNRNKFNNLDFSIKKAYVKIINTNQGTEKVLTVKNSTFNELRDMINSESLLLGLYQD